MSVAPDVLMTTTASVSTTNTANVSVHSAESGGKQTDSFSQVYAREQQTQLAQSSDLEPSSQSNLNAQRYQHSQTIEPVEQGQEIEHSSTGNHAEQGKSVEHSGAGKPNRHDKDTAHSSSSQHLDRDDGASDPAVAEEKATELADSGKTLPPEQEDSASLDEGSVDDSFLLLGLFDSTAVSIESDTAPASGQLTGGGTAQLKAVGTADVQWDEELSLNLEDAGQLTQQAGELSSHNTEQLAEQGNAVLAANEGQLAAVSMSSMGISASADDVATAEDADSSLLELDAVDSAEGGNSTGASQSQLSDLGELGQLLAQPQQTARSSLVPGQALDMQSSNWNESLADQVMWMSSQNLKSAQIQLEPADLGRLDVHISMDQEQTLVSFSSSNAAVRDALESQSQRLRDMFSQQGMNLVDVNVSDQSQGRGAQGRSSGSGTGATLADYSEDGIEEVQSLGSMELPSSLLGKGSGLVDFYA